MNERRGKRTQVPAHTGLRPEADTVTALNVTFFGNT